ncbi:YybH family protein [Planosporangium sp. 12N6]|uniref:YybH family protein n=1 Tax=Planosporangium spinosum TaxID=3402278 RepID=UPI003CF59FDE
MRSTGDEVLGAARALVAAFGAHDVAGYFASFADDASFVFHNTDEVITSRARYEQIWRSWEADGFRVLGCRSLDQRVQVLGADTAVFTHRVRTRLAGEPDELRERETIVFRRDASGGWLAVHEHLSPDPSHDPSHDAER